MAQLSVHVAGRVADRVDRRFPPRTGSRGRTAARVKTALAWIDGRPVDHPLAGVALASGEAVLAATAESPSCGPVLLTDRALYHRPTPTDTSRIGWEFVGQVSADSGATTVSLTCLVPQPPHSQHRVVLRHGDCGHVDHLLATARDQVAAATLVGQQVLLRCGLPAMLVARRRPGSDTPVWFAQLPQDAPLGSPDLDADVEHAMAELSAATGVTGRARSASGRL